MRVWGGGYTADEGFHILQQGNHTAKGVGLILLGEILLGKFGSLGEGLVNIVCNKGGGGLCSPGWG